MKVRIKVNSILALNPEEISIEYVEQILQVKYPQITTKYARNILEYDKFLRDLNTDIILTNSENFFHFHHNFKENNIKFNFYNIPYYIDDIDIIDIKEYNKKLLDVNRNYLIIGDVHGCIDEAKELLTLNGFEIKEDMILETEQTNNTTIIFVGDIVDKGSDKKIVETIKFIYKNRNKIKMIKGNHEKAVMDWFYGDYELWSSDKKLQIRDKNFTTYRAVFNKPDVIEMLFTIYEMSNEFYICKNRFIVSHSPVEKYYLKRLDDASLKQHMKSSNYGQSHIDTIFRKFILEADHSDLMHIFGHLQHEKIRRYKNKIDIDTGCIYGYHLSSIFIDTDGNTRFNKVDFMCLQDVYFNSYEPNGELFETVLNVDKFVNLEDD